MKDKFKQALKQEKNKKARRLLDAFYRSLVTAGTIKSYQYVAWAKDGLARALQFVGCDVLFEKKGNIYRFVDEKVCKNYNEMMYFEIDMAGRAKAGWAVSEYKKTDIIIYFIEDVGLFVLPFKELRLWLLENEQHFEQHFSIENKGRKSNRNIKVSVTAIKEAFPKCFVDIDELEFIANNYDNKGVSA